MIFHVFAIPLIRYGRFLRVKPCVEGPSHLQNGDISSEVLHKSRISLFLFKTPSGLMRMSFGLPSCGFSKTSASSRPPRRERREPHGVSFSSSSEAKAFETRRRDIHQTRAVLEPGSETLIKNENETRSRDIRQKYAENEPGAETS